MADALEVVERALRGGGLGDGLGVEDGGVTGEGEEEGGDKGGRAPSAYQDPGLRG